VGVGRGYKKRGASMYCCAVYVVVTAISISMRYYRTVEDDVVEIAQCRRRRKKISNYRS